MVRNLLTFFDSHSQTFSSVLDTVDWFANYAFPYQPGSSGYSGASVTVANHLFTQIATFKGYESFFGKRGRAPDISGKVYRLH